VSIPGRENQLELAMPFMVRRELSSLTEGLKTHGYPEQGIGAVRRKAVFQAVELSRFERPKPTLSFIT
jgi:hypothetical protein